MIFMYFNSIDDILKWIDEDDIVIKLTGEESKYSRGTVL